MAADDVLLEIEDLHTHFLLDDGVVSAVDGVDLRVRKGETLAIVGESGCGKSVMARSILRLVDPPGHIEGGRITLHREGGPVELVGADRRLLRQIRWNDIAMVFQEPMASLSLVHTIGSQIVEAVRLHENVGKAAARQRAIEMLDRVGIPMPQRRVDAYPFELSGGMRQRAMIAMALSCRPSLLIADEPTTALDVTTQAQILELLRDLQAEFGMAIMLITHDLGVAAQVADSMAVMYLGRVVEYGSAEQVLAAPRHPYSKALLRSMPRLGRASRTRLTAIKGMVPPPFNRPGGCTFHPRCDAVMAGKCDTVPPRRVPVGDREVTCLLYEEEA
ncbi:ABC transporter ATP-binding protein [Nonomuraea sp. CA-141351]|uniref:ABC transporter ATP-binding protein n=1 Tax=Nonomuraea sp. CA-141351 TaxID=3239996 RepID=UPI003D8B914E